MNLIGKTIHSDRNKMFNTQCSILNAPEKIRTEIQSGRGAVALSERRIRQSF